uniref:hypothetical protein n=1 Tax=Pleurosigma intermedium TaxID=197753 RepID=UPI0021822664|nr:hypothetical protein N4L43_pgp051 [Pleurosigma intermedium]UVG42069.1 hypothetical protein [Pleurosigma intermedium]
MTLFITTPKRQLEIDDASVAALMFLIAFAVGKIVKAVIEKQKQKRRKNIHIANPRGGDLTIGLELSDDTELAKIILSCISDNERYLAKDPRIIQIVFNLVKAKIKRESLIVTPNMMRFLALNLINNDQTLIVKIGNILASSNNRIRLFARLMGAVTIGFLGALSSTLPYAVLMMVIYFDTTENCGYNCSDYFEQLPKEEPVNIYEEKSTGHIFIGANDDARQIAIHTPSKAANEVTVSSDGSLKTTKQRYHKVRPKAKQVSFSDFKKTDPVLSSFSDLEEPDVPQKICPISNDIHDVISI